MTRDIRFRAWGATEHSNWKNEMLFNFDVESADGEIFYGGEAQPEWILMQYTGLKDKNGKEIYDGDCFGGTWGDGWVAYCDKCKSLQYFMKDFGCAACSGDIHWAEVVEDDGNLEVIGNIWENPELLK